jgi:DNA repair exonuclease SbcCD ATPase subunit
MTDASLQSLRNRVQILKGEHALLLRQQDENDKQLASVKKKIDDLQKVIIVFQKASEYARQQMKFTIDEITTNALQVVFGGDIAFEVELGTRAGAPTAEFFVVENGLRLSPLDAKGGGLVDVISTALRLAILELYEPRIEGPVLLDEPGKMVSSEYVENFVFFLKSYSHKVGRQFIVITHNSALAAAGDRTFRVRLDNGVSEVVEA